MLHKFASRRWMSFLKETLNLLKARDPAKVNKALRRLRRLEQVAPQLSPRYRETPEQLRARVIDVIKRKGFKVKIGKGPGLKSDLEDRIIVHLPENFSAPVGLHEMMEAISLRRGMREWDSLPVRKKIDFVTKTFKIDNPALVKDFFSYDKKMALSYALRAFNEPLSHGRGVLKQEFKNILPFYMLHPNSEVRSNIQKILSERKMPIFVPAFRFKLHGQTRIKDFTKAIDEYRLAFSFPRKARFIEPLTQPPVQGGFPRLIGGHTTAFELLHGALKLRGMHVPSRSLATLAFLYGYPETTNIFKAYGLI